MSATSPNTKTSKALAALQQQQQDATAALIRECEIKVQEEKAGKRKLFHALVKLANEVKRLRSEAVPLQQHAEYANEAWYEGGLWRAPRVLPGVQQTRGSRVRLRDAISLSDLFFNLVTVTAFTRVGLAVSNQGTLSTASLAYFAVFWNIWSKEASYSTRFDTTDLSAQVETLVTCFAVLFASLSVSNNSLYSVDSTRIMMVAGFTALLHLLLMVRVCHWSKQSSEPLEQHVLGYAKFNVLMNTLEAATWAVGIWALPQNSTIRPYIFLVGILLALRVPRAFMANDFHAASSKRSVLFILLLGFMLQSVVVVATDFFEYQPPTLEQYSFISASCLLLFCIKLLYVDDSATLTTDHALLVNRTAALFFNLGQFALLLSTTVMGSGLTLLTHSYLAAAAALPDNAKNLVCGGFAAVLLSTTFIKSLHLRRVPVAPTQRRMFIGAYCVQMLVTLSIIGVTAAMCFGHGGYLKVLMNNDVELLWVLSGFALLLVVLGWLDEGLELALVSDDGSSDEFLVHPFGFWWCLTPEVSPEEIIQQERSMVMSTFSNPRLSVLSPLLGESVANMKLMDDSETTDEPYGSV